MSHNILEDSFIILVLVARISSILRNGDLWQHSQLEVEIHITRDRTGASDMIDETWVSGGQFAECRLARDIRVPEAIRNLVSLIVDIQLGNNIAHGVHISLACASF
jgi:hypothetical protein